MAIERRELGLWVMRRGAAVLFWPTFATVVWGELSPDAGHPWHLWDKLLHFAAYGTLGFLGVLALMGRLTLPMVCALSFTGGLLELAQSAVGRDASLLDAIANTLGATAGALAGCGLLWLLGAGDTSAAKVSRSS
jgi:VanZ family protein